MTQQNASSKPAPAPAPAPSPLTTPAKHEQDVLDEALDETFPSSDPIAVNITKEEVPTKR